jgi:DNA-binding NarL/FixJ family response regulator
MNSLKETITSRDIAVLRQLLEGATLEFVAYDLGMSEALAWAHFRTIFRKLQVENRSQAVTWARQNGIS